MSRTLPTDGRTITYIAQFRKCNKERCRCHKPGEQGHGPYWYAYWKDDGGRKYQEKKLVSRYIGKVPQSKEAEILENEQIGALLAHILRQGMDGIRLESEAQR